MPDPRSIPPDISEPSAQRVLAAIKESDQFDDWLTDPIYYEDHEGPDALALLEADRESGLVSNANVLTLQIPRRTGKSLVASALPLPFRTHLQRTIAAFAPRIRDLLRRDKVLGFEFLDEANRLFTTAGEGLEEAWNQALTASMYEGPLRLLDIDSYNASISRETLRRILESSGAPAELVAFALSPLPKEGAGAPSIDDAYAFLYNYFLRPVDEQLFRAERNFVRYRDEYFVFSSDDEDWLHAILGAQDLTAKTAEPLDVEDLKYGLMAGINVENSEATETLERDHGYVEATYACLTWEDVGQCSTDYFEALFRRYGPARVLRELLSGKDALIDGVELVPVLRRLHRSRQNEGAWRWARGVDNAAPDSPLLRDLGGHRTGIKGALEVALNKNTPEASWQVSWAAPLLADLGDLQPAEFALLEALSRQSNHEWYARQAARLALARSAVNPPAAGFEGAARSLEGPALRGAAVTSWVLRRRGNAASWRAIRDQVRAVEPALAAFLEESTA